VQGALQSLLAILVREEMDSHLCSSLLAMELEARHKGSVIEDQCGAVTNLAIVSS
jgi:hypothetical protein